MPDKIEELKKAADSGDIDAQVKLGRRYLYGRGVTKDQSKAFEIFKIAAESGNVDAQVGLAILYGAGKVIAADHVLAKKYLTEAAAKKNTWALLTQAIKYSQKGTASDFKKAHELLEQALNDEDAPVGMRCEVADTLAHWYGKGIGVPADQKKQFEYFLKSADLGDADACSRVGSCYWSGVRPGGKGQKDIHLGLKYLQSATELGSQNAAMFLAHRYEYGDGVPTDFARAIQMFELSAANGSRIAPIMVARLRAAVYPGSVKPVKTVKIADLINAVDEEKASATDFFNIACAADLNDDNTTAIKYYRKTGTSDKLATLGAGVCRDLKRIEYFRTERMNDYFLALASSAQLTRMESPTIKLYIPEGSGQYSTECRKIILDCANAWSNALERPLQIVPVSNEESAHWRFIPVDKEIFYNTAIARTCYLNDPGEEILSKQKKVVIQLPVNELTSQDDEVNFRAICLHEIGHALGLRGHSLFASDVMFTTSVHVHKLSDRDKAAINALYDSNAEDRILKILKVEADRNSPFALGRLGTHFFANKKEKEAIDLLEKASELGDGAAQFSLGLISWRKFNFKKAAALFDKAGEAGIPQAKVYRALLPGIGRPLDKESVALIQTSAAHGDVSCLVVLGTLYTFGDDNIKRDTARGAALLKQASEQGSSFAKLLIPLNAFIANSEHFFGLR